MRKAEDIAGIVAPLDLDQALQIGPVIGAEKIGFRAIDEILEALIRG